MKSPNLQVVAVFMPLEIKHTQVRCRGSTGATGAWAPAEISQRVPGTRPEKELHSFQEIGSLLI